MSVTIPQPWLADALELLDLRRNDRVLVFSAPTMAHVAAVRQSVGSSGRTLVIEPDRVVRPFDGQARSQVLHVPNVAGPGVVEPGQKLDRFVGQLDPASGVVLPEAVDQ